MLRCSILFAIILAPAAFAQVLNVQPTEPTLASPRIDFKIQWRPELRVQGNLWIAAWATRDRRNEVQDASGDWISVSRSFDFGATWTPPAVIESGNGAEHIIAFENVGGDRWLLLFEASNGIDFPHFRAISEDNGATWGAPELIAEDDLSLPVETIIWSGDRLISSAVRYVSQSERSIILRASNDLGTSWYELATINSNRPPFHDLRYSPQPPLVTDGNGTIVAAWSYHHIDPRVGSDDDIHYVRSVDNGDTWSALKPLSPLANVDGSDTEFDPVFAHNGNGRWICAWFDMTGNSGLYLSTSDNNAESWSIPRLIHPMNSWTLDHRLRLVTDSNGTWIAMWSEQKNNTPDSDVFYTVSTDNGMSWSQSALFNSDGATDGLASDIHLSVATDERGRWMAMWSGQDYIDIPSGVLIDENVYMSRFVLTSMNSNAPQITQLEPLTTGPLNDPAVAFSVSFSKPVLNFTPDDLRPVQVGATHSHITLTGGPKDYFATVHAPDGAGTIRLALNGFNDVQDAGGLPIANRVRSNPVAIDTVPPELSSVGTMPSVARPGDGVYVYLQTQELLPQTPEVTVNTRAATFSHFIRKPLGTIYVYQHLLEEDEALGAATIEALAWDALGNYGVTDAQNLSIIDAGESLPLHAWPATLALIGALVITLRRKS